MLDARHGWNVSFKPGILGFIFSLALTVAAYRIVTYYHLKHEVLIFTIFGFGIVQALVQLVFFLHLGLAEEKPRWNLIFFCFTVVVLIIVIGCSLWIMHHLHYNLVPAAESGSVYF